MTAPISTPTTSSSVPAPAASTINELSERLASYLSPAQIRKVVRAYRFSSNAHEGQFRASGEAYVTHPLAVANILADMHMDEMCLMAALMHDTIEDTGVTKEQIRRRFGSVVADLVDGVSKLNKMEYSGDTREEQQAENFLKMTLAMSRDIRVILVKLADRLHNMRTLGVLAPEKRRRIARETLEIYAPIAQRLGINDMRVEFEDLGFQTLHPMRARRLAAALDQARGRRRDLVAEIQQAIEVRLESEGIGATVSGREKHLYSIYRKMRRRRKAFKEIMDVFAFRIVTDSVDSCYRALGVVHNLYKPIPGEFKDYIAIPKTNGYQSLHSVLVGMHAVPIEVQIRTAEMDEMANFGIAAHWFYKTSEDDNSVRVASRVGAWIRELLEIQQQAGNPLEFIEHVKSDLFPDEVYVFTPKGRIIQLPSGATPVDFAYAVHTDIGNTCVGCRVNGRMAPLSEPLQSGQVIQITTAPKGQPHPGWLDFVVTAKARSAIRHNLKNMRLEESIQLGRRMLNKVLLNVDLSLDEIPASRVAHALAEVHQESLDEVLQQIGLGNRVPIAFAKLLLEPEQLEKLRQSNQHAPVVIDSAEGHVISFARCCHPIPGDPIVGHFSAGRGLVVHRESCRNVAEFLGNPEQCMPITWSAEPQGEFQVELRVEVNMFRGVIAELAACITEKKAGIENISIEERGARMSVIRLNLRVADRVHLADIMKRIRHLSYVQRVRRGGNS